VPTRAGAIRDRAAPGKPAVREEARLLAGAEFVASAATIDQLPIAQQPEVAFAGRSNAGKSSAINTLTGRRSLAFVSKLPGRTRLLNLFHVPAGLTLVDLPGYGYSKVPGEVREGWQPLLEQYLALRSALVGVVVVMDVRHPLTTLDRQLIEWLLAHRRPIHVLLTKSDKLSNGAARQTLAAVEQKLLAMTIDGPGSPTAQLFSSASGLGIFEVEDVLRRWTALNAAKPAEARG
jgi:GTP-binding protein